MAMATSLSAARKPVFFGLWSLFYVPFVFHIPIRLGAHAVVTRFSVGSAVALVCLVAGAVLVECYVLFRFAQSLQSASLCTKRVFSRCRRAAANTTAPTAAAIVTATDDTEAQQQQASPASPAGGKTTTTTKQCPIARSLSKLDDAIHNSSPGQLLLLLLSAFSLSLCAIVAVGFPAAEAPPPPLVLVFLSLVGTLSFIPYAAFRAVMALGYLVAAAGQWRRRRGGWMEQQQQASAGSDEERGRLLQGSLAAGGGGGFDEKKELF